MVNDHLEIAVQSWDIFLAHTGADKETAETLYDLLNGHCRVFIDSRCLRLGDDWDAVLASVQRASRITVVLVSKNTEEAYYQREEVAAAIAMARKNIHRVVPIFLYPMSPKSPNVPYGLRLKHSLSVRGKRGLEESARQLRDLLAQLDGEQLGSIGCRELNREALQVPSQITSRESSMGEVVIDTDTARIELTIDRDFDSYTDQEKNRLLTAIKELLAISSDIRVTSKKRGSVKLTLELTVEQAKRLLWAVKAGKFAEFGVVDACLRKEKQISDENVAGRVAKRTESRMGTFKAYYGSHNIEVSVGESLLDQLKAGAAGLLPAYGNLIGVGGGRTLLGVKCHARLSIDGRLVDQRDISAVAGGVVTLQGFSSYGTPTVTATVKVATFKYYCSIYADGHLILEKSQWHS
jgi:TIR domain